MRVTFACGALVLEGELDVPADCRRAAVICHPHPQYGGNMHNPVVRAVAAALYETGCAALRFNFRGVGASGGQYGGGVGEKDDVRAGVRYVIERGSPLPVTVAGYSFGAMLALQVGAGTPAVDRLIAVAPPLSFFDLEAVGACAKPKLFVVGDRDQYCSVDQLTRQLALVAEPKVQRILQGADHFFAGYDAAVADAVRSWMTAATDA